MMFTTLKSTSQGRADEIEDWELHCVEAPMVRARKEIILHHIITKELVFVSLPLEAWG